MRKNKLSKTTLMFFALALMSLLCFSQTAYAEDNSLLDEQAETIVIFNADSVSIETLDNGDYIETVISSEPTLYDNSLNASTFSTYKYITKTKTIYYKNSSGTVLWSVSIKATFKYNGTTSSCTSCSHSTTAPATTWSIKSCTSSKSGNTATAKAVAVCTGLDGTQYTVTKSVTITCSASGVIS